MAGTDRFQIHDLRRRPADFQAIPLLLALNVGAFILQQLSDARVDHDAGEFVGQVTQRMWLSAELLRQGEWWRLLTHGFAHGGFLHLLFNLYGLLYFGRSVEGAIGTGRFYVLYFLGLLAGGAMQVAWHWHSPIPMLGASGAVLAVTAGAAMIYPEQPVHTFFGLVVKLRNFALVFFVVSLALAGTGAGGVAHAAHLGGLLSGILYTRWVQTRGWAAYWRSWLPRRRGYQAPVVRAKRAALHTCAVCGVTEHSQPPREFRVCGTCAGGVEYCTEHLANHPHRSA